MKYRVDGVSVIVTEDEIITSGSVKVCRAEFEFDASWDGFTKLAVFKRGGEVIEQLLVNDGCDIPWEVLQIEIVGDLHVGVRGIAGDAVRPTCWAVPKTIQMGAIHGDKSKEPTPDIYQQLIKMLTVGIEKIEDGHRVTFNDAEGKKVFDVMDGDSITITSVTESTESGGENVVEFSDGKALKVRNGKDGAPGKNYTLTEADKVEIAEQSTTSGYVTIPESAWTDDMDLYIGKYKSMRISYRGESGVGHHEYIIDQNSAVINEEWGRFVGRFIYANSDDKDFVLNFFGSRSAAAIQPYDIADIKIYLASDPDKVNILSSDIGDLGWAMSLPDEGNKFSMAFDDGLKYIHVWRQSQNIVQASANTGIKLIQGEEYVFECRMRMTCRQIYYTVPLDGVFPSSSTIITPTRTSAAVCVDNRVRGFAQRIGEISFTADTKPAKDVTVMVSASHGKGGMIANTHDVG